MASITEGTIKSTFQFTVKTKALKKSNSVCTQSFEFSGSKWMVEFSKKSNDNNEECLAVRLKIVSMKKPWFFTGRGWSREVQATFKLLQPDGGDLGKSIVKYTDKTVFERKHLSHGIDDFVEWNKFFANYTLDDRATFEVGISAAPLTCKRKTTPMVVTSTMVHLAINQATKLSGKIWSKPVKIQGVRFRVRIQKKDENVEVHVIALREDLEENWFYNGECTMTMVSDNVDNKHTCRAAFHSQLNCLGYINFIDWAEFVNPAKGFINKENTAHLTVEIKVEQRKPLWKMDCAPVAKSDSKFECILSPS